MIDLSCTCTTNNREFMLRLPTQGKQSVGTLMAETVHTLQLFTLCGGGIYNIE